MTTIANTSAIANATSPGTTNASAARIADNFDQFLQLLTTQLKNQSPLDPLDTNQFTQQLVQFASVEQQIKTNDQLTALTNANRIASVTGALSFVGANVTADGAATALKDGRAAWKLNAPRAGTAVVTITDRTGNQVHSRELTLSAGDQDFVWDGRLENGQSAPAGEYRVTVAAKDGAGQVMVVKSEIAGIVDSVDVTGSDPILKIGEVTVPVSAVRSIRR